MTREQRLKQASELRLVGAGIGSLIMLATLAVKAQFGLAVAGWVCGILMVGSFVGSIWWQRRLDSRQDQSGGGWSGSWLDKPPYRPEKPTRRWW